ncbi:S9 family peptidase [Embleya sp. NPDC005575]|uniref:S9 family peptidase n=1 Tax=Embleya sp. NPDC005575 TaxID=3156892 RepID=UPI00339E2D1E
MTDFHSFVPVCRYQPSLVFSPDGTTVACASNFSGQYNLWLHPIAGGRPRQLTRFTDRAVRQLAFAPDGKSLVFSADHRGGELRQVYTVPADGGEPHALTAAPDADHLLARAPFSPDGSTIAYAANDRDPLDQDLILLNLASGDTRRFKAVPQLVLEPVAFSPDGATLLVFGEHTTVDSDLYRLGTDRFDGPLECLTAHTGEEQHRPGGWLGRATRIHEISDAGRDHMALLLSDLELGTVEQHSDEEWDVECAVVSADGRSVAWVVNVDGSSVIRACRDGVESPTPAVPIGQVSCLAISPDGRSLAFLLDTATRPTELCTADLRSSEFRFLTDNRPAAARTRADLVAPELVRYPTHDGRAIPAYVYRPRGEGPFPVVLSVHGGPEEQERPIYRYAGLYQYLLANGIAVLAPNVRGSTGYGTAYQKLIHRDWGGGALGDLEQAARYLRGETWVDPERIAVFGGSFGGFAALSCLSRLPQYWAAGVSVMGPSDLITFARSAPATWRPLMTRWLGDPDTDAELLAAQSPMTHIDRVVAPLFVLQGAQDRRVARAESDQIVAGLRSRGLDVRYDVYGDEGHGFMKRENEIQAWSDVGYFLVGTLRRRHVLLQ